MKSITFVIMWTILLIAFGWYNNTKISEFTDEYTSNIDSIEEYIKDDEWSNAKNSLIDISNKWHNEKDGWYKILDHQNFDDICLYLNILDDAIYLQDKSKSLEQIEMIKNTLDNIFHNEKCDIDHIL